MCTKDIYKSSCICGCLKISHTNVYEKRIITCVQKEEVKCPFNGDSGGSDLLKARGEIAIWSRTFVRS